VPSLIFRDARKGTISIEISGEISGGDMGEADLRFGISGPALRSGPEKPRLQPYSPIELSYERGEDRGKPPYCFFISGKALPTRALNDRIYLAKWNTRQWIGELDISLKDGEANTIWKWETEIVPLHLPYREEQAFMFRQLESWMKGLARAGQKPVQAPARPDLPWYKELPSYLEDQQVEEFLTQLKALRFHLEKEWVFYRKWQSQPPEGGENSATKRPGKQWVKRRSLEVDTAVNRWLIQSLLDLLPLLTEKKRYPKAQTEIQDFIRQEWGSFSPLRYRLPTYLPPAYQRWYRAYLSLFSSLSLGELPLFKLGLKDLPQLYEYWCFFKVAEMVGKITEAHLDFQNLLEVHQGRSVSRLLHGQTLHFSYRLGDGESRVILWYQKSGQTEVGQQRPDIWMEVYKAGIENPFIFFLDSKFQLKPTGSSDFEVPKEALDQLHRYRDALLPQVHREIKGKIAQKALGAVVLFPYPKEESEFTRQAQYHQLYERGIGALPLRPHPYASHQLLEGWLREVLEAPSEALFEQMITYDKTVQEVELHRFQTPLHILPYPSTSKERGVAESHIMGYLEEGHIWRGLAGGESVEIPLFGGGDWPEVSNLGALDAALRYTTLHLLWIPDYLGLRLWQEMIKIDPLAYWDQRGLHLSRENKKMVLSREKPLKIEMDVRHKVISPGAGLEEILLELRANLPE